MKLHMNQVVTTPTTLVEFVAQHTDLSKSSIKKALNFGGGWLQARGKGSPQRCRRASKALGVGDRVKFYFDDQLYTQNWPTPTLIQATPHWGIWYKPVNLVAQGTPYGDHGSMEQQVLDQSRARQVFLIHRLDREASGLMIFAYTAKAAAALSALWRDNGVTKIYQAEVSGVLTSTAGTIDLPLDDKEARTHYTLVQQNANKAQVQVRLETGRLHQIRRHFAMLGHPLLGDPKYGDDKSQDPRGLRLVATTLHFRCPLDQQLYEVALPAELRLF